MKALIVDDDLVSRMLLQEILTPYGTVHVAVNGQEALDAVSAALQQGEPYELICLDIMMPGMGGQQALNEIRALEAAKGQEFERASKIVMTTALRDIRQVMRAFDALCDAYLVKPIEVGKMLAELRKLGLLPEKPTAAPPTVLLRPSPAESAAGLHNPGEREEQETISRRM